MSYDNAYGRMIAEKIQAINQRKVDNMGDDVMVGKGGVRSGVPLTMGSSNLERVIGGARINRSKYAWEEQITNPSKSRMVEKSDTSSVRHGSLRGEGIFSDVLGSFGLGDMKGCEGGAMAFGDMSGGKKKRGRPKKQTSKDIEDEKFAMDIKTLQRKQKGGKLDTKMNVGGAMAFGDMSGGAMAFGQMKKKKSGKGILSDLAGSFGLGDMKGSVGYQPDFYPTGMSGKGVRKLIPMEMMKGDSMSGGAKTDGRKKRAEVVRKVMKDKGLSMIEASKYVKQHGLY